MVNYRTIREVEEEYLRNHLDEIDDYITVLFDDYAESCDTVSLLRSLNVVGSILFLQRLRQRMLVTIDRCLGWIVTNIRWRSLWEKENRSNHINIRPLEHSKQNIERIAVCASNRLLSVIFR